MREVTVILNALFLRRASGVRTTTQFFSLSTRLAHRCTQRKRGRPLLDPMPFENWMC
jgi:hypothetical protein